MTNKNEYNQVVVKNIKMWWDIYVPKILDTKRGWVLFENENLEDNDGYAFVHDVTKLRMQNDSLVCYDYCKPIQKVIERAMIDEEVLEDDFDGFHITTVREGNNFKTSAYKI